jgi:hypothetical protein
MRNENRKLEEGADHLPLFLPPGLSAYSYQHGKENDAEEGQKGYIMELLKKIYPKYIIRV